MKGRYWAIDTEGNGANPNEVIELGAVEIIDAQITGRMYCWRFRPFAPITFYATKVHGIRNGDLAHEPTFAEKKEEIFSVIGNEPIIGHAVSMELSMLKPEWEEWNPVAAYDTLKMAKRLLPNEEKHKLSELAAKLNIADAAHRLTQRKAHNGLYDSAATAMLCLKLKEDYPDEFEKVFMESEILRGRRQKEEIHAARERRNALKAYYKNGGTPPS